MSTLITHTMKDRHGETFCISIELSSHAIGLLGGGEAIVAARAAVRSMFGDDATSKHEHVCTVPYEIDDDDDDDSEECALCMGEGFVEFAEVTKPGDVVVLCSQCRGSGRARVCPNCRGSGFEEEADDYGRRERR